MTICQACKKEFLQTYQGYTKTCMTCINKHYNKLQQETNQKIEERIINNNNNNKLEEKTWFKITVIILRAIFVKFPVFIAKLSYNIFAGEKKEKQKTKTRR